MGFLMGCAIDKSKTQFINLKGKRQTPRISNLQATKLLS